jgi:hypothetical protein
MVIAVLNYSNGKVTIINIGNSDPEEYIEENISNAYDSIEWMEVKQLEIELNIGEKDE